MGRGVGIALAAMAATIVMMPASAGAAVLSAGLTGINGEGTFNNTLPCGVGDGPNWRYFWAEQPATSPNGAFHGLWNGSFEVHDAGGGNAFIPNNDGRLSVSVVRGGTGFFDLLGDGGCANATLDLTTQPDGDPQVTGSLPITALGGTGSLRGLIGSGVANFNLELGPGADNVASVDFTGNFDVTNPGLTVVGASSRWRNLSDWLNKKLGVTVTVKNDTNAGHAFFLKVTAVTGGTNSFSGVPTGEVQYIPAGSTGSFRLHDEQRQRADELHDQCHGGEQRRSAGSTADDKRPSVLPVTAAALGENNHAWRHPQTRPSHASRRGGHPHGHRDDARRRHGQRGGDADPRARRARPGRDEVRRRRQAELRADRRRADPDRRRQPVAARRPRARHRRVGRSDRARRAARTARRAEHRRRAAACSRSRPIARIRRWRSTSRSSCATRPTTSSSSSRSTTASRRRPAGRSRPSSPPSSSARSRAASSIRS